jgi:hypothetical protein
MVWPIGLTAGLLGPLVGLVGPTVPAATSRKR